jgi:hypothetical protein
MASADFCPETFIRAAASISIISVLFMAMKILVCFVYLYDGDIPVSLQRYCRKMPE